MDFYTTQPVQAKLIPSKGKYLQTRYEKLADGAYAVHVGMGSEWNPLSCKEIFGKGMKTVAELECESCAVDLSAAVKLGSAGIYAAMEGIYGGAYEKKFSLSGECEPTVKLYAFGEGVTEAALRDACMLAKMIIQVRNLVNCPANILNTAGFAQALEQLADGLPVSARLYSRDALAEEGLNAILAVGDSSANPPMMAVLRYDGDGSSKKRVGYVGKGVTIDSGGYCLKPSSSMSGIKGDMAGGAAAAAAVCALAGCGVKVNAAAIIPIAENRISPGSLLPGDVIRAFNGKTIEVLNSDAEGRLLLADALSWAVEREGCTHLVDIATLTGAIYAMLGHVASGTMAVDEDWYACLEEASILSGEKFWRMPMYPEYEKLIDSDYADVRNTSKEACGAIAAGLFLHRFTDERPWIHMDIAGTADCSEPIWAHQISGATGSPVSTLFHLGCIAGRHLRD